MSQRARHFVSPAEVAELAAAASGVAGCSYEILDAPELQFVQFDYRAQTGAMCTPPTAFYGVSELLSGEQPCSYMAQECDGSAPAQLVPLGATVIHQLGTGAAYAWTAPHRARMTCLAPQLLARAAEETGIAHPARLEIRSSHAKRDLACHHLLQALAEEASAGPHLAQPLALASIASALACRLLSHHNSFRSAARRAPGGLTPRQFAKVRAYLEDNLGRRVSLDELAALVGVSRFHFARSFRRTTGESPMGYLMRVRIERAKQLLQRSGASVAEVALALGFADQSHFTRTFRRLLGTSPTRYARLHGEPAVPRSVRDPADGPRPQRGGPLS